MPAAWWSLVSNPNWALHAEEARCKAAFAHAYGGAGLDVLGGLTDSSGNPKPIFFPSNVTTNVATYEVQLPNPLQGCHWNRSLHNVVPGLPLIATLPKTPTKNVVAELRSPNGESLQISTGSLCIVDQYTYYSTDTAYGPTGLEISEGDNAIVLIPSVWLIRCHYKVVISDAAKRGLLSQRAIRSPSRCVGQIQLPPGWRLSEHVKRITKTGSYQAA